MVGVVAGRAVEAAAVALCGNDHEAHTVPCIMGAHRSVTESSPLCIWQPVEYSFAEVCFSVSWI
jgi:hypothetical protein